MKISGDEKHFPLLNYFIVRNTPQTAGINIRKKRIAEKKFNFYLDFSYATLTYYIFRSNR